MKATIIAIGNEILIGQITNTNAPYIAKKLSNIGIQTTEMLTVGDTQLDILQAIDRALTNTDIVLITGGLGPTKDDITKTTLAQYFDSELILYPNILSTLESYFQKRGIEMLDSLKNLAYLPHNCLVFPNQKGLCAAMCFEKNGKILVSMPGVPAEMKNFMEHAVVPHLQKNYPLPALIHSHIICAGIGESQVAEKIKDIENELPTYINLAYLPSLGVLKLRLSASGNNAENIEAEVNYFAKKITEKLGNKYVFAHHEDATLQAEIGKLLSQKNWQLAVSESCTGGLIAHKITTIAGCSAYFKGGAVTYSNALKQSLLGVKKETLNKYGAVSKETVNEMLIGTLQNFNANCAIAISGIAGPAGATETKPVGTVFIGIACPQKNELKQFTFFQNREMNLEVFANTALNELRKLLID